LDYPRNEIPASRVCHKLLRQAPFIVIKPRAPFPNARGADCITCR
jgi:hypothetical protein